jgi:hypothetical protein
MPTYSLIPHLFHVVHPRYTRRISSLVNLIQMKTLLRGNPKTVDHLLFIFDFNYAVSLDGLPE